jgi:DNA (cytosine-5)-methyltransferase 1
MTFDVEGGIRPLATRAQRVPKSVNRPIVLGSTCSGAGTVEFALKGLGVDYTVAFACDSGSAAKKFYMAHHSPKFFLDDALDETHEHAPRVDLYSAGWPCQPFSMMGKRQGMEDEKGRGQVVHAVIGYVQKKQPRCSL